MDDNKVKSIVEMTKMFLADNPNKSGAEAAAELFKNFGVHACKTMYADISDVIEADQREESTGAALGIGVDTWNFLAELARGLAEMIEQSPEQELFIPEGYPADLPMHGRAAPVIGQFEAYDTEDERDEAKSVFGDVSEKTFVVRHDGVALRAYCYALELKWSEVVTLLCGAAPEFPNGTTVTSTRSEFTFVVDLHMEIRATATFRASREELRAALFAQVSSGEFPLLLPRDRLSVPVGDDAWRRMQRRWAKLEAEHSEYRFMTDFESDAPIEALVDNTNHVDPSSDLDRELSKAEAAAGIGQPRRRK